MHKERQPTDSGETARATEKEGLRYDDHGNFLLDGDLELQWMKLHRDIQGEYRLEQLQAFLRGLIWVGGIVALGWFAITRFNAWFY